MITLLYLASVLVDGGLPVDVSPLAPDGGQRAEAAQLTADLEGTGLHPGEAVTLVLRLRHRKTSSLRAPDALPEGKGLMATGPPQRLFEADGDHVIETLRYPLVILDVGEIRSPGFEVHLDEQPLKVPPLPLQVMDAGPSPQAPEVGFTAMTVMRPGPPVVFYWVLGLIGLLALLTLLVRFWPRGEQQAAMVVEPPVDPYQQAMKALKSLRRRLKEPDQLRMAWFELLAILRTYLDAQFGLHTAESTSEEILRASTETALPGVPRRGLKVLLEAADQVRYAGADADREAIADLLDQVEGWIQKADARQRSVTEGSE